MSILVLWGAVENEARLWKDVKLRPTRDEWHRFPDRPIALNTLRHENPPEVTLLAVGHGMRRRWSLVGYTACGEANLNMLAFLLRRLAESSDFVF